MNLFNQVSSLVELVASVIMAGGFLAVLTIIWKASARFTRLEEAVHRIADNDLPHLYREVQDIKSDVKSVVMMTRGGENDA